MRIFDTFTSFLVISFLNIYFKINWMEKENIVRYFQRKSSVANFPVALEVSANLMQLKPFYFKLKFLLAKLMKLL